MNKLNKTNKEVEDMKLKDMGVKIISKEQDMWEKFVTGTESQINSLANQLTVNTAILEMARKKLQETKDEKPSS